MNGGKLLLPRQLLDDLERLNTPQWREWQRQVREAQEKYLPQHELWRQREALEQYQNSPLGRQMRELQEKWKHSPHLQGPDVELLRRAGIIFDPFEPQPQPSPEPPPQPAPKPAQEHQVSEPKVDLPPPPLPAPQPPKRPKRQRKQGARKPGPQGDLTPEQRRDGQLLYAAAIVINPKLRRPGTAVTYVRTKLQPPLTGPVSDLTIKRHIVWPIVPPKRRCK
jgi:hypothetical protein